MEFLYLAAGLVLGALIAWLFLKGKMAAQSVADPRTSELDRQNAVLVAQVNAMGDEKKRLVAEKETERSRAEAQKRLLEEKFNSVLEQERSKVGTLTDNLARKEAELKALQERLDVQKKELEELQQRFTKEFENLANKIFEEKSKKFTEQNRTQLDDLLKPLGEKIKDFEKKVNDVYVNETRERASLKEQLSQLHQLNQQMSKDAQELTGALKGDSQVRGAWGQRVLESVLEKSGLVKDREYRSQTSFTDQEGQRHITDIIVDLPDHKHLIVDSKVSLIAYTRYTSATNEEEKQAALKEHLVSVRRHVRDLGDKKYQNLYQLNSLDFVLLFMPIESAFALAVQEDHEIFNDAFARNIVIVSPSTLLATLRTVANIWRQEYQNRNAQEIARLGGSLIDKLAGFLADLEAVGKKLEEAADKHSEAIKKLHTGRGNVIITAEKMRALGAKADNPISAELVEKAAENDLPPAE